MLNFKPAGVAPDPFDFAQAGSRTAEDSPGVSG